MSRTPSSIHGGCDPARSTTGHTHNIACAFYEDFSDLARFAAAPAAPRDEIDDLGVFLIVLARRPAWMSRVGALKCATRAAQLS
jgi:hypothetical protein